MGVQRIEVYRVPALRSRNGSFRFCSDLSPPFSLRYPLPCLDPTLFTPHLQSNQNPQRVVEFSFLFQSGDSLGCLENPFPSWGNPSTHLFGGPPSSIKHPMGRFLCNSIQNCRLEVANHFLEGFLLNFGGCRFTYWRLKLSLGSFIEERGHPKKGGYSGFQRQTAPPRFPTYHPHIGLN